MENVKETGKKLVNKISDTFHNVKEQLTPIDKRDYEFNARQAWVGTTYGKEKCLISTEEQIQKKIAEIRNSIEGCYKTNASHCLDPENDYFHIVNIERNIRDHADEIMEYFSKVGFKVVNLSKLTPVLNDTALYVISWRDAFDERKSIGHQVFNGNQPDSETKILCD